MEHTPERLHNSDVKGTGGPRNPPEGPTGDLGPIGS
jgi:hypothetical protein